MAGIEPASPGSSTELLRAHPAQDLSCGNGAGPARATQPALVSQPHRRLRAGWYPRFHDTPSARGGPAQQSPSPGERYGRGGLPSIRQPMPVQSWRLFVSRLFSVVPGTTARFLCLDYRSRILSPPCEHFLTGTGVFDSCPCSKRTQVSIPGRKPSICVNATCQGSVGQAQGRHPKREGARCRPSPLVIKCTPAVEQRCTAGEARRIYGGRREKGRRQ